MHNEMSNIELDALHHSKYPQNFVLLMWYKSRSQIISQDSSKY